MKFTEVEKYVLLSLLLLGRRRYHTVVTINNVRLWKRWYPSQSSIKALRMMPPAFRPRSYSQTLRATERSIFNLVYHKLVEFTHEETNLDGKFVLQAGPFYRLTKEGKKMAEKIRHKATMAKRFPVGAERSAAWD